MSKRGRKSQGIERRWVWGMRVESSNLVEASTSRSAIIGTVACACRRTMDSSECKLLTRPSLLLYSFLSLLHVEPPLPLPPPPPFLRPSSSTTSCHETASRKSHSSRARTPLGTVQMGNTYNFDFSHFFFWIRGFFSPLISRLLCTATSQNIYRAASVKCLEWYPYDKEGYRWHTTSSSGHIYQFRDGLMPPVLVVSLCQYR